MKLKQIPIHNYTFMSHRFILFILLTFLGIACSYAQSGIRAPGIYEVGDTTIEVYELKELNAIREFKIINGTDIILFKEFNRLTKKIREEGSFKGGYSNGNWKFYNLIGRVKREVNYDDQVKTFYEKKMDETPINSLGFDYEKYKTDSVVAEKYWRMKREAQTGTSSKSLYAKKNESPKSVSDSTKRKTDTMVLLKDPSTSKKGIPRNATANVNPVEEKLSGKNKPDSIKQRTEGSLLRKLLGSKKENQPSGSTSKYVPPKESKEPVAKEIKQPDVKKNEITKVAAESKTQKEESIPDKKTPESKKGTPLGKEAKQPSNKTVVNNTETAEAKTNNSGAEMTDKSVSKKETLAVNKTISISDQKTKLRNTVPDSLKKDNDSTLLKKKLNFKKTTTDSTITKHKTGK